MRLSFCSVGADCWTCRQLSASEAGRSEKSSFRLSGCAEEAAAASAAEQAEQQQQSPGGGGAEEGLAEEGAGAAAGSSGPPLGLPSSLVKRIVLMDSDVKRLSSEALRAIAKAAELFAGQLAVRAMEQAAKGKRKVGRAAWRRRAGCARAVRSRGRADISTCTGWPWSTCWRLPLRAPPAYPPCLLVQNFKASDVEQLASKDRWAWAGGMATCR